MGQIQGKRIQIRAMYSNSEEFPSSLWFDCAGDDAQVGSNNCTESDQLHGTRVVGLCTVVQFAVGDKVI